MAFNQGPQPEIVLNENGVRYIDPNPTNEIVNHEDLVMYVKLLARTKGRSILTVDGDETTTVVEQRNVKSETNFTYPTGDKYLDTRWTNIGGGTLNMGEDVGAFGITNINIEFKSSFMPQIVIDFVDIRGATLFEQGPCSPYAAFFHLPYPVFELTVKGYYGKPVTYTLALVKFNTKFNADTGNFESKAEFVGYTYAFLADIPMGYVLASTYMKYPLSGKDVLKSKWEQLLQKPGLTDTENGLPAEPLTVFDLIRNAKKLETELPRLKNDTDVKGLSSINAVKAQLTSLKDSVEEYKREFLTKVGNNTVAGLRETNGNRNTVFLKVANSADLNDQKSLYTIAKDLTTQYFGVGDATSFKTSTIGTKYDLVLTYYTTNNLQNPPNISIDTIKPNNTSGFLDSPIKGSGNPSDYYIDLYEGVIKEINRALTEVEVQYKEQKEVVRKKLNDEVRTILGFFPNIRNVFAIILTNVEVFLELLLKASVAAEEYHDTEDATTGMDPATQQILDLKGKINAGPEVSDENKEKVKIYPWPTYYEKVGIGTEGSTGDPGSKEKFPGDNINFISWPEVLFVEDFIKALTELAQDIALLDLEVENLPGFDNFAPITPFETQAFGEDKAPNRWYNLNKGTDKGLNAFENLFKVMGENAFIIGDYTMLNTLTLWKSQLGFTNGWGFESLTNGAGTSNGYGAGTEPQRLADNPSVNTGSSELGRYGGKGMPLIDDGTKQEQSAFRAKIVPTTRKKMKLWGYVDALNCMSTLSGEGEQALLQYVKNQMSSSDIPTTTGLIKTQILNALRKQHGDDKILVQSFSDWKKSATSAINGTVDLVDKQISIWNNHFSYVKSKQVLTLTGPIGLNDSTELTDTLIYANPQRNSAYGGARLVSSEDSGITSRSIDFNKEKLGDLWIQYKINYAYGITENAQGDTTTTDNAQTTTEEEEEDASQTATEVDTNVGDAKDAISIVSLQKRPKWTERGTTAYENIYSTNDPNNTYTKGYGVDKNLGILTMGVEFYPNFYHTLYNAGEALGPLDGQLGETGKKDLWDLASSRTIRYKGGTSSFEWANFVGENVQGKSTGDPIVQTPLWTLNYPLYKNPWYWNSESGHGNVEKNFLLGASTYRRNYATWWGLNQWGIDDNKDVYKPLAYLAVMSFGFDNQVYSNKTGHFPPYDGDDFDDLSSFSNFTNTAISATLPKSYVLLIGAILWRMKESGYLEYEGIKRSKANPSDGVTPGWNSYNQSVSIDDLADPVWFFHNSLSRPTNYGGSVFYQQLTGIYNRTWSGGYGKIDVWSNSNGNTTLSWLKTNSYDASVGGSSFNRDRGMFDQCRPDQLPFLFDESTDFKYPKTLIITDSNSTIKGRNISANDSITNINNIVRAPSRITNKYPVIKERIKELMFLPATFKNEFIVAFENWATSDTFGEGGWLNTIDALNWEFGGTDWKKKDASNNYIGVDTQFIRDGSLGWVSPGAREKRGYGIERADTVKDFFLQCYSVDNDLGIIAGSSTPSSSSSSSSNNSIPPTDVSCFVAGSKIKLSNGKDVNVEDLTMDDIVLSYNIDTNNFEESSIGDIKIDYRDNIIIYYFDNGIKVTCTETHPIWVTNKGWSSYVQAEFNDSEHIGPTKQIVVGDECLYYKDNTFNKVKISKISEKKNKMVRVWNIKNVTGNHNFIVNNVLVHNAT
jgi:hypothetical protein